jgi:hypothetical protein
MKKRLNLLAWAVAGPVCVFLWPIFVGPLVLEVTASFWLSLLGGAASFLLILAAVGLAPLFPSRR